jgi:lsr operon transcriptional repressor
MNGATGSQSGDLDIIGKAARLHYEYGLTHQEVAEVLHISRVKVTRLLKRARDLGVVQIRVLPDVSPYAVLETQLTQHFGLDEALVVPTMADDLAQRTALAGAAARYLQRVVRDGTVVAIGLSRTIALVHRYIVDPRPTRATFVSLVGGMRSVSMAANPYEGAEHLARLFGGVAEHLLAPAIAGSPVIAEAFLADPATAKTLDHAANADVALLGLGGISAHTTLVDEGELTPEEVKELLALGAVGDMAARFFDANGDAIQHEIDHRVIGLTLAQIRRIPVRLVVAGGADKTETILGALRAGLADVIVLDAGNAERILRQSPGKKLSSQRATRASVPES